MGPDIAWYLAVAGFLFATGRLGVLVRRYGLDGETPATLADLSEELHVSRERVRQLQREAERILRDEGDFGHDLPAAA